VAAGNLAGDIVWMVDPMLDLTVDNEIRSRLVRRLLWEKPVSEVMHVLLVVLIGILIWPSVPHDHVLRIVLAVTAASIGRGFFRVRARAQPIDRAVRTVRLTVVALGLAWGASILLVGPVVPMESLSLVIVVFAGLVAGATVSLLADPVSFYLLLGSLLGPLSIAIARNGSASSHFLSVLFIGLFGVAMSAFFRRSHAALVEQYRTSLELERTTQVARDARDAEQYLVRIIEATTDHVGIAGADGMMRYLNRAGRAMIGIGPAQSIAELSYLDLFAPASHEQMSGARDVLMRDGVWTGDAVLLHRDGIEIPVSLVTLAHFDAEGNLDSVSAIARDTTEQLSTREALRLARDAAEQSNAAKSSFLANTSHEIRTPLNGILGMVELLLDTDLSPSQRRSVELIASSGETLLNTINDVLDLSKIEAHQLTLEHATFDLCEAINAATRLFSPRASAKGLELVADIDPSVPQHVVGDAHRLGQVLANLVGNAVKFTERGEVVVRAHVTGGSQHRPVVRFSVKDSGIGIAPRNIERMFAPFQQADTSTTRQYGGTGLGLSISRRLVDLMGGRIRVESAQGIGSDFHFEIPLERSSRTPTPQPWHDLRGCRVLAVDDHPINRRVLDEMLRSAGCDVLLADSVANAIDSLTAAASAGRPVNIVVSDVHMAGADGFALATAVQTRKELGEPRVALLTSGSVRGDTERSRELGVVAFLEKPVSRSELLAALGAALSPADDAPRAPRPSRITTAVGADTLRILLAEDNAVNQQVALAMLGKRGHDVTLAVNGVEAVDAVRDERFDVILMDVQMPEMDGLEATRRIRELPHGDIPIIALTANASTADRDQCLAAGMDGFIAKPFRPAELFRAIEGASRAVVWSPADAPDLASSAPVDLPGFREMLSDAGIAEAGDKMLDVFLSDSPARARAITDAVRARDWAAAARAAHGLKSAAGNIRANRLARMLGDAEDAGLRGDADAVAAIEPLIQVEYAAVRRCIERERALGS
jgi:two-component system sensor histidine kinase/response regulator